MRRRPVAAFLPALLLLALLPRSPAQSAPPPAGEALRALVALYLQADAAERRRIRDESDRTHAPLAAGHVLDTLRKDLLAAAAAVGPKISLKGRHHLWEAEKKGKYIASGGGRTLFLGLHGGGVDSGEAESAAGAMGGGGWTWIFPEVLVKTGRGWTTAGTEEFVIELIRAAKRSGRVDPDHIYVSGHSMGGYGTWTIGAHHADLFAGTAAYAGAPSPSYARNSLTEVDRIERGVLPNLHNLRHYFFQSRDDRQVPPPPNLFAHKELLRLKQEHPLGFDFRFDLVEDRGHAAPKEGYLPTQKWVAGKSRDPRPRKILWEPTLPWKRQFYWLYWEAPVIDSYIEAEVKAPNTIHLRDHSGTSEFADFSILVGPPLLDPDKEVIIRVDGKERKRAKPVRRLSTLLLTLVEHDEGLLFDARIDL